MLKTIFILWITIQSTVILGRGFEIRLTQQALNQYLNSKILSGSLSHEKRFSPQYMDYIYVPGSTFVLIGLDYFAIGLESCDFKLESPNKFSVTFPSTDLYLEGAIAYVLISPVQTSGNARFNEHQTGKVTVSGLIEATIVSGKVVLRFPITSIELSGFGTLFNKDDVFFNVSTNSLSPYINKIQTDTTLTGIKVIDVPEYQVEFLSDPDVFDLSKNPEIVIEANELILSLPFKVAPPVVQISNKAETGDLNQSSFLFFKKSTDADWSPKIRSGFGVYDNWIANQNYDLKSRERLISKGTMTYLFNNFYLFNFPDLKLQPSTGIRQATVKSLATDQRYDGRYFKAQYLSIKNNFDGVNGNYGQISLDNQSSNYSFEDYYFYRFNLPYALSSSNNSALGLSWQFVNWSDGVTTANRTVLVNQDITLTANWKAMMASKAGNWVQSVTPYTANGTRVVA